MRALSILIVAATSACIDIHPSAPWCEADTPPEPTAGLEFHRDVRPILRGKCAGCHREDGAAGFSLDTYQEVVALDEILRGKVVAREMPPWKAARCCNEYLHDFSLTPDEIATIDGWIGQGAPEGEFVDPPPIELPGLSRVDLELAMDEPYLPVPPDGTTDETRCFLIDWPLDETAYVTGFEVVPGAAPLVHHALVLIASPDQAKKLAQVDAEDTRPGWSCPGGIVTEFTGYLGLWTPGYQAVDYPADLGQKMEPGDKIILSVHYSLHELGRPDQTSLRVKLDDAPTRLRKALSVFSPAWTVGGLDIPAGDSDVEVSYVSDPTQYNGGGAYDVYAINIHMHERGSRGLVSILRRDGSTECLLQIDDWDDRWQGDYVFAQPIRLEDGDRLYVECHWDNTEGNQRVLFGTPEKPRDLSWAEDQEMCIAFVTVSPVRG